MAQLVHLDMINECISGGGRWVAWIALESWVGFNYFIQAQAKTPPLL